MCGETLWCGVMVLEFRKMNFNNDLAVLYEDIAF